MLFHQLQKEDLNKIVNDLHVSDIAYKKKLGLNKETKFGIEIEFIYGDDYNIVTDIDLFNKWFYESNEYDEGYIIEKSNYYVDEEEIHQYMYINNGWEIKTEQNCSGEFASPVFEDNEFTHNEIKEVYDLLNKNGAFMDYNCGLHISFDGLRFSNKRDNLISLLKLYAIFEKELIMLGKGDFNELRPGLFEYAPPVRHLIINMLEKYNRNYTLKDIVRDCSHYSDKWNAINISGLSKNKYAPKNRIEFRMFNGTINPETAQTLINITGHFIEFAIHHHDVVDELYELYSKECKSELKMNDLIEADKEKLALLGDLIFEDDKDILDMLSLVNKEDSVENILEKKLY